MEDTAALAPRAAALVGTCIANTVALMRRNTKWAGGYGGGGPEEGVLAAFRALRRSLYTWSDWAAVPPLEFLAPFLALVRSDETSGPITGAALAALQAVLQGELVQPQAPGAGEAMHALVDAVTHCRFEATDPGHDEAVLASICDVLLAALRSRAGSLLSDDAVCAVVQAAYHIGHQSGREGALLTNCSRRTLRDAVSHVFATAPAKARDAEYTAALAAAARAPRLSHAPATPRSEALEESFSAPPRAALSLPYGLPCCVEISAFAASLAAFEDAAAPAALRDELRLTGMALAAAALDAGGDAFACYPPLLAVVREDLPRALVAAAAAPGAPPALLAAACSLMVALYLRLRPLLKHQLAAFLQFVLLPLGEGGAASAGEGGDNPRSSSDASARADAARIALEALADLCRQPGFGADLFANFDADVRWPSLFEHSAALLAKATFPSAALITTSAAPPPLQPVNLAAMDGLLALLRAMAQRCGDGDAPAQDAGALAVAAAAAAVHASESGGSLTGEPLPDAPPYDPEVWGDPGRHLAAVAACLAANDAPGAAAALRRARAVKARIAAGAAHFNRDDSKGLAYLRAHRLLPPADPKPDPAAPVAPGSPPSAAARAVAAFLRYAAPLDKAAVGEYLGQMSPFVVAVLDAYAALFDFRALPLDAALRLFLDGFLLPGEAQKISRCLEAFAHRFHACNAGLPEADGLARPADADAAYVLCYSIIMLNTDLHNPQVRNKMTVAQFVKNNRGTNAGADWPPAYLQRVYSGIAADEIRLSAAGSGLGGATAASWLSAARAAAAGEGGLLCATPELQAALDGDLFAAAWGPLCGALACAMQAGDASGRGGAALADAAAGFRDAARIAAANGLTDAADAVVATLVRFTEAHGGYDVGEGLGADAPPEVLFGQDERARAAALAACSVAARHGDSLREEGWSATVTLLLRLARLGTVVLPSACEEEEGEGLTALPALAPPPPRAPPPAVGILRGFSSLLSLDAEPAAAPPLTAPEEEAVGRAKACGAACRVGDLLADSKFLEAPALQALTAAVCASGDAARAAGDAFGARAAVDVLGAIALRNRDRLLTLWPAAAAHLAAAVAWSPSAERAMVTLLRLARRLLPYKEDLAEALLGSLAACAAALDARAADSLMPRLALELRALLAAAAPHVGRAPAGWSTVCRLLAAASRHAEAAPPAFDALQLVLRSPSVPRAALLPAASAAAAFAASRAGGEERSRAALALLPVAAEALVPSDASALQAWADILALLRECCRDERPDVRDEALVCCQRALLAGEALDAPVPALVRALDATALPLFMELVDVARRRGRDAATAERSLLRAALPLLVKPLLHFLARLRSQPAADWARLWGAVLDALAAARRVAAGEELAEAIPEALKNCILVVATPDGETRDPAAEAAFWELTWRKAATVDAGLTPQLLAPRTPRASVSASAEPTRMAEVPEEPAAEAAAEEERT